MEYQGKYLCKKMWIKVSIDKKSYFRRYVKLAGIRTSRNEIASSKL